MKLTQTNFFLFFRGFGLGQKLCQDVTISDCNVAGRHAKQLKEGLSIDQEQCQAICDAETDCAVFRFHKHTGQCQRFNQDYRSECITGGGTTVLNSYLASNLILNIPRTISYKLNKIFSYFRHLSVQYIPILEFVFSVVNR